MNFNEEYFDRGGAGEGVEDWMNGILPTEIAGWAKKEIAPNVWLITNPRFRSSLGKWTALANVNGMLCVVELRVFIEVQSL